MSATTAQHKQRLFLFTYMIHIKQQRKTTYRREEWYQYSERVKQRDGYRCINCGRSAMDGTILQVHHTYYERDKKPWEYPLSACVTLCKGCHATEHNIIEPSRGWLLLSITDLGDLDGECEAVSGGVECGTKIRHEHLIYHPRAGYKIVGSTCVDYLTKEDVGVSKTILGTLARVRRMLSVDEWAEGRTKNGKRYTYTEKNRHEIRVYGHGGAFAFQVCQFAKRGFYKIYNFGKIIRVRKQTLEEAKELACIAYIGMMTNDTNTKTTIRELYKRTSGVIKL